MAVWRRGPLITAGIMLGAGLGGFLDGILLHQIMQWHSMLSAQMPSDNLISAKMNMAWDGYFHLGVWLLTLLGVGMLFAAGARRDVPWSGRTLLGSMLFGWGLFNLIEGVINHHLLGIHHVYEYTDNKLPWDLGFLLIGGLAFLTLGWSLMRRGRHDVKASVWL